MGRSDVLRLLELLTHSRLWVASMVTCLAAFATLSLRLAPDPLPLALVFFCALGIYNLDHIVDLPREESKSARVLAATSLAVTVILLTRASIEVALLVVGGAALSCAYFIPIQLGERRIRIETVPVMKPLIIGTAVAIASTFVPLMHAVTRAGGGASGLVPYLPEALFRAGLLSLLCGANSLVFDLRDVAVDRAQGVPTAPIERGTRFTRLLISVMLVVAIVAAEVGYRTGITAALDVRRATQAAALCTLFCTWAVPAGAARSVWALCVDGTLAVPLLWTLLVGA